MNYDIFGTYNILENMDNSENNNCIDNPNFQCSTFANTYYKCYNDNYNHKYKNCCATCKTMPCVDTLTNCQALAEAGLCNNNNHQIKENIWNKCCSSCNLLNKKNQEYSNINNTNKQNPLFTDKQINQIASMLSQTLSESISHSLDVSLKPILIHSLLKTTVPPTTVL